MLLSDHFAEADQDSVVDPEAPSIKSSTKANSYVHIRIQQRNGRKSLTTVQGLASDLDLRKILKALKKTYNTNGTILTDDELGEIVQLQGDQRRNVSAARSTAPPTAAQHGRRRLPQLTTSCAATRCSVCFAVCACAGSRYEFLTKCNICRKDEVKIHGF